MGRNFELRGYDHIKVVSKDIARVGRFLTCFGFQPVEQVWPDFLQKPGAVWGSGDAFFVLYAHDHLLAAPHYKIHPGGTVFDLCFFVDSHGDHPMQYEGVGGMKHTLVKTRTFKTMPAPAGLTRVDHNTLNLERGMLEQTVKHYEETFGLEKGQYFDIHTSATGLYSWVTRSKDRSVQIPFNESQDDKSQIQEYIETHHGPGVQHIALDTKNIIETMDTVLKNMNSDISFLNTPDTYYEMAKSRVKIRESVDELQKRKILVDQDSKGGYLLQIFTQAFFNGIFFELIQREGNDGFGEGNFKALFEAMELDQKRRGAL